MRGEGGDEGGDEGKRREEKEETKGREERRRRRRTRGRAEDGNKMKGGMEHQKKRERRNSISFFIHIAYMFSLDLDAPAQRERTDKTDKSNR